MPEYAKLKNFFRGSASASDATAAALDDWVQALGEAVKKGRHVGQFALHVIDKRKVGHYCVDLGGGKCEVRQAQAKDATLSITCTKDAWAKIAAGRLSPIEAFYLGQMQVQGDLAFAKRLYAKAASRRGTTDF